MINEIYPNYLQNDFFRFSENDKSLEIAKRIFFNAIPVVMSIKYVKNKIYPIFLSSCFIFSCLNLNEKLKKGESFSDYSSSIIKETLKVINYVGKAFGFETACAAVNIAQIVRVGHKLKKDIKKNKIDKILEDSIKLIIYSLSFSLIFCSSYKINFMIFCSKLIFDFSKSYFFFNNENHIELVFSIAHSIAISINQSI